MTLKKYGIIFVSSGLIISGMLVWDSGDKRNLGESVAAVLAAKVERENYAYAFGTNAVVIPTNIVTARRDFDLLYDAMDDARDMTIDNGATIYWIDSAVTIDTGDVIAASGSEWSITNISSGEYRCILSSPTNITAMMHTSSSLLPSDDCIYMPDIVPEYGETGIGHVEMCEQFYPGAAYASNTLFEGYNNWWQHIGISSNVYKYDCEEWRNTTSETIRIYYERGAGFTNSADVLEIAYPGVTGLFTTFSTTTNDHQLLAALYRVETWSCADSWFVVSDADEVSTNVNITFSDKTLSVPEGSSTTLNIHPSWDSGKAETISWTSFGSGLSASGNLQWTGEEDPTHPEWDTAQSVTVYAGYNSSTADGAGIIRFSRSSEPTVYQYVAVTMTNTYGYNYNNDNVFVNPSMTVMSKGESETVEVEVGPVTNVYMVEGRRLKTNDLFEAKKVLESLNRSIVICQPSQLTYGTRVTYEYYGGTGEITANNNPSDYGNYNFSDALSAYNSEPKTLTYISTNSASFDGIFVDVRVSLSTSDTKWVANDSGSSSYSVSFDYELDKLSGCSFGYPSKDAFESNYVARFRVFLCLTCDDAGRYSRSASSNPDAVETYSASNNQPWFYESYNYSSIYTPISTINDGSMVVPDNGFDGPFYSIYGGVTPIKYKIVEIVDEANPTDVVTFDIGGDISSYEFSFATTDDFIWEDYEIDQEGDGDRMDRSRSFSHNNRLEVYKIIIVVDWSWQHFNPDTPFEPELNTPAWTE